MKGKLVLYSAILTISANNLFGCNKDDGNIENKITSSEAFDNETTYD